MSNLGRYRLTQRIAVGGMAEIYKAVQTLPDGSDQFVGIKVILQELSEDEHFVQMFRDEARISAHLKHPNIVQVYEFGEQNGRHFIVMEFVDGPNLKSVLHGARKRKRTVPIEVAAAIVRDIASALDGAHHAADPEGKPLHVVHRDVSPQNILVSRAGVSKLTDFGIAKAAIRLSRTEAGHVRGKMFYMSPEQISDLPLDHRSDQYSLGIVLYEMISGVRAAAYDPKHTLAPLSSLRKEIPNDLDVIVQTMLQRDSKDRYESCGAVAQALSELLHHSPALEIQTAVSRFVEEVSPRKEEAYRDANLLLNPYSKRLKSKSPFVLGAGFALSIVLAGIIWWFLASQNFLITAEKSVSFRTSPPVRADPPKAASSTKSPSVIDGRKPPKSVEPIVASVPPDKTCPKDMVEIPSGEFFFGSKSDDPDRNDLSEPQLKRTSISAFCIDQFEFPNQKGESPLTSLGQREAERKCLERSKRLCRQEEWERACKGPQGFRYPYGNQWVTGLCPDQESADGKKSEKVQSGDFQECRSYEGVFDLSGSVEEWTASSGRFDISSFVARGGARALPHWAARCSAVREYRLETEHVALGFRCCEDPR